MSVFFNSASWICYNHNLVGFEQSDMDSINSTQEGTGSHDMWPIDDDGIIIGEGGASGGIGDETAIWVDIL